VYLAMGDHAAALPLCRQALEIKRTALGEVHPSNAISLMNLAISLEAMGRTSGALPLMEEAAAVNDRMIGQVLVIGSERQRIVYLNTILRDLHAFLSLVLQHLGRPDERSVAGWLPLRFTFDSPAAVRAALDLVLRRKAIAAEATGAQRDAVLGGKHAALEPKLRELAALAVPARGESDWKPEHYVAFVLAGGAPDEVHMIDLGEAEPIDRLIADFRAGIIAEAEAGDGRDMAKRPEESPPSIERDAGLALRATLFDRLAPALGSRTRLLMAPDGDLMRLPFEVLPATDGRRLIDDYQISYLSCGRDVLRFGAATSGQPGEPLVIADPDFDLEALIPAEAVAAKPGFWARLVGRVKKAIGTPTQSVSTPATAALSVGRHSRDLDRERSAYHFHRLPGTRAEGERVATWLGVSPWLDATALEGRLKTACRSPRILHLATHGFFLPDQERDLNREERGLGLDFGERSGAKEDLGRLSGPLMENPMLRSGLALAGANTWLKASPPPEDGLLTAEDVTGLDLLATELVVLSACETGLGQFHAGEGVVGLRRAFVLAGAKTLVMSLWKVPDEPTRELMEDFYRRLLAGQGRAEALRDAQLAMKAKYPESFYWGAFICQGDPSPLGMVRPGSAGTGVATDLPTGAGISPDRS
jgi:CHAT domain-containing protein